MRTEDDNKMTLLEGKLKQTYQLEYIDLEEDISRRLQMLGLTKHASILVLNRKRDGSMIIKVRGTRFAIGRQYAAGIYVGGVQDAKESD